MFILTRHPGLGTTSALITILHAGAAFAQEPPPQQPVLYTVGQLYDLIDAQRQQLEAQQRRIEQLEYAIRGIAGTGPAASYPQGPYNAQPPYQNYGTQTPAAPAVTYVAQPDPAQQAANGDSPDQPVGEADPDEQRRRIDVSGVQDIGGVLTRKNHLVFEPSAEFESTSSTRFFFDGVEIIETVLVGDIQVSDADRNTISAAGTIRYGITNRSEVEVRVPFIYRDDDVTQEAISTGDSVSSSLDAANIGDVEATLRYQINDGQDDWPIFIANARVKSTTGRGPYDIDRDADGLETELATGSGFWAVQPSVSVIYPSDPVVFFGNVSYTHSFGYDVDETIGDSTVGEVQPGDVIGFGFGMGFALNDKASFSVGYAHDFVLKTRQEIDGEDVYSDTFDVGRLSLGFSYALTDDINLNLNTQVGVTDDAPDVVLTLRTPITFNLN